MNSSKSYSQGADRDEHYDRPQTRARPFRRFCAAVATSREVHRWPRLNLEVPYRRWEWALRRAHRELSWWSCEALLVSRDSKCTFQVPTRLGSGHCGLQGLPAREKAVGVGRIQRPAIRRTGFMEYRTVGNPLLSPHVRGSNDLGPLLD